MLPYACNGLYGQSWFLSNICQGWTMCYKLKQLCNRLDKQHSWFDNNSNTKFVASQNSKTHLNSFPISFLRCQVKDGEIMIYIFSYLFSLVFFTLSHHFSTSFLFQNRSPFPSSEILEQTERGKYRVLPAKGDIRKRCSFSTRNAI